MNLKNFSVSAALCALTVVGAQAQAPGVLSISGAAKLSVPRGGDVTQSLKLQLQPGYHVNSNTPNEEYLIPIRLTWDTAAGGDRIRAVSKAGVGEIGLQRQTALCF